LAELGNSKKNPDKLEKPYGDIAESRQVDLADNKVL
jgi:hypothetical protein